MVAFVTFSIRKRHLDYAQAKGKLSFVVERSAIRGPNIPCSDNFTECENIAIVIDDVFFL
jgi:hypothetical protein